MLPGPPRARSVQDLQTPQGSAIGPFSQLIARARIRALVVLPQPRGPEKRYAWFTRLLLNAFRSGTVTWSCPITSENFSGRYRRYSARGASTTATLAPQTDKTSESVVHFVQESEQVA